MNAKEARIILRSHRPGQPQDARFQKALGEESLKQEYQRQAELDNRVMSLVHAIPLPEGLLDKMTKVEPGKRRLDWRSARSALKQPPVLAALIGLAVMVGILVFFWLDRMQSFPGREAVFRMISTTQEMSGAELEPLITEAGKLGDWFMLKYGLEDFNVPPEFAGMKTAACRLFKQDGFPVAQIAIKRENAAGMLFFIFRAEDFGVKLPSPDRWYIFTQEDWSAAVRGEAETKTCFMVAVRGKRQQLEDFLKSLSKETPG